METYLGKGGQLVLIVVTQVKGSSPGRVGFKMVVTSDGELLGSIGGGVMEYKMVELAKATMAGQYHRPFLKRQVHSPDAGDDASGLICAGEQMHAFVPLNENHLGILQKLRQALNEGIACLLRLSGSGMEVFEQHQQEKWADFGAAGFSESAAGWSYTETVSPPDTVYIFGGGHISVPLSEVCRMTGFRVVVLDDREGLGTMTSNIHADEKRLISYNDAGKQIAHPPASYVCIMTVSHASDELILGQVVSLPLRYLGMIGSKNKVSKIFSNLQAKGIIADQLERVDAPMGLAINSESPAEIAVSIVSKMIMEKNKDKRKAGS